VEIDVRKLLTLPASERLELADILRKSVGYPAEIETLRLPAWQRAHMDHLLETYTADREER
jgi:hypothetical protein